MAVMAIPAWNAQGVLPPINELNPVSAERSPYQASLVDLVLRFGQSPERRAVLDGFLRHRDGLHAVGLTSGFQWLDGSFLEHIELLECRAPQDIDVVTFYRLPAGLTPQNIFDRSPTLFDHAANKTAFRVDSYTQNLGSAPESLVQKASYWYSMWAHRRNYVWKGFIQVDLAPVEDANARATLANLGTQGVQP